MKPRFIHHEEALGMSKGPVQPPPTAHEPATPDPAASLASGGNESSAKARRDDVELTSAPSKTGLENLAAPTSPPSQPPPPYKPPSTYSPLGAIPVEEALTARKRRGSGAGDVKPAETSRAERRGEGLTLSEAERNVAGGRRKS